MGIFDGMPGGLDALLTMFGLAPAGASGMDESGFIPQGGAPMVDETGMVPGLGDSSVPIPLPRPPQASGPIGPSTPPGVGAPQGPMPSGTPQAGGDRLLAALRAIQAPKPPDVVKPSTPAAPTLRPIQSGLGDLMSIMGGPGSGQASPYKLPPTLLAALGGGGR